MSRAHNGPTKGVRMRLCARARRAATQCAEFGHCGGHGQGTSVGARAVSTRTTSLVVVYNCAMCQEGTLRMWSKLTWLVLGEDPIARSRRVEQFIAP